MDALEMNSSAESSRAAAAMTKDNQLPIPLLGSRRRLLPPADHSESAKRPVNSLYALKLELAALCSKKSKWLDCQRKASLLVEPYRIDEYGSMAE